MKELNLDKQVVNRLQDEDMEKLLGADGTSKKTIIMNGEKQMAQAIEDEGSGTIFISCCRKSCN